MSILLFGGDGTIHRHLGQLVRLGLPVLVVPAGSGNDFARSLGLRRVRDSLAAWQKFCAGADERADDRPRHHFAYADAGEAPAPHVPSLLLLRGWRWARWRSRAAGQRVASLAARAWRICAEPRSEPSYLRTVSDEDCSRCADARHLPNWTIRSDQPTLLAAFANTPLYGGGMKIAPRAKMDDGLLDVCVVGGMDPFKLFCLFPTVYAGRHLSIREVEYFQSARVRVETEHPLDVYADGEYVCRTPVEVSVRARRSGL